MFTRCLAVELAPEGVRVNVVNPGIVPTNIHQRRGNVDKNYRALIEKCKSIHPIGESLTTLLTTENITKSKKGSKIISSNLQRLIIVLTKPPAVNNFAFLGGLPQFLIDLFQFSMIFSENIEYGGYILVPLRF